MSFPLDLAMFSLLLFRVPTNYNFDIGTTTGVPPFTSNDYINESLLFESYDDIVNKINGNVIETQLGMSTIAYDVNKSSTLYFYRLSTIKYDDNGYKVESYCPLYVSKTIINDSEWRYAKYDQLFKIEFNLHAPRELYINFVVDETFGNATQTRWLLNNSYNSPGNMSYYHDYYYVFNVDYAYYEGSESISSLDNSNWYKFNLQNILKSNTSNTQKYFNINLATLETHLPGDYSSYGHITQINNYICFKNDSNFSQVSYDTGFTKGYEVGKNESVDESLWIYSFTRSVFNGFAQVLNVDILPNIKLGYLIAIPLVLSVLRFILGFFKGD